MEKSGICCAGNWVIDTIKIVDIYPEEEKLSVIHEESMGTGGCPYNVPVDLGRGHRQRCRAVQDRGYTTGFGRPCIPGTV